MENRTFTVKETKKLNEYARDQYEKMNGARFYRNADFVLFLLTYAIIAIAIRTFLFEPVRVEGESMLPTLLDRETMFVEKVSYMLGKPERGDIVICFYPGYKESCVKRVVGLPGETLTIRSGKVWIDGEPLNESEYWKDLILSWDMQFKVEEGSVFVMGDNRNASKDSRNTSVGCIPYEKILGKVRSVIWPIPNFRTFGKVAYS